ncbi:MAG: DUF6446 family protein [Marinibacterium sp.]
MNGKLIGGFIVLSAILAGGTIYYLQVYGFYQKVQMHDGDITLVSLVSGQPEPIAVSGLQAIDAESSPIRFRACFETTASLPMLTETYELVDGKEPRNAPAWFDCFDAEAIGDAIEAGTALTFLSQKNIEYGVDRIVAITEDGHGYVWHDLNHCGEKAYDGTVVGEECPPLPNGT